MKLQKMSMPTGCAVLWRGSIKYIELDYQNKYTNMSKRVAPDKRI